MVVDRFGNTISVGDDVMVVGKARSLESDEVLVVTGDGRNSMRIAASETAKAGRLMSVLARVSSGSAVGASSTSFHELFSFTIPASVLGTNGCVSVPIRMLWNVASGQTQGRWLVNGINVWQNKSSALSAGTGKPYYVDITSWLGNDGSTSAQKGGFRMQVADDVVVTSDSGTALGRWGANQNEACGKFADTAEDSTAAITFSFEAGFDTSNAGNNVTLLGASMILEPWE